jgi:hypothetical protein
MAVNMRTQHPFWLLFQKHSILLVLVVTAALHVQVHGDNRVNFIAGMTGAF